MILRKKIIAATLALSMAVSCMSVAAAPETEPSVKCEHSNKEIIDRTEPDCITPGYTLGIYCNDCNTFVSGHMELKPIGHIDADGDMICDDCGTKFTIKDKKEATCTSEGYSGDTEDLLNGRIIMGSPIPKLPHTDKNKDYICDVCHAQIPKNDIYITLHFYMTNEDYDKNKDKFPASAKIKDSENVPGCKYVITTIKTKATEEIAVPAFPKLSRFVFQWQDVKGAIYKNFVFTENTDLYMAYAETMKASNKGQCGENAYWKWINEEKRLVFYGEGTLWDDWKKKADMPWYGYISEADRIILTPGIIVRSWNITE